MPLNKETKPCIEEQLKYAGGEKWATIASEF